MVKKVIGEFNTDNFEKILQKLGKHFDLIYTNDTLYVALRLYADRGIEETEIKKILRPARNFIIKEMDMETVKREGPVVSEWCSNKFTALERQRYEVEQQAKLQKTMQALDNMEKLLEEKSKAKQIINKEGGDISSGSREEEAGKTQEA